jgi:beta-lactamase class A
MEKTNEIQHVFRSLIAIFFLFSLSTQAEMRQTTPLERRAADVAALFRNDPSDYQNIFTPDFLAQVPPAQLTAIFKQYFSQTGRVTKTNVVARKDQYAARFEFVFEKNFSVPVDLGVESNEPYRINYLLFGNPVPLSNTLDDISKEIKTLPGDTSFLVARLGAEGIVLLSSYNQDRALAIGSTFKLYILSELVRSINANERQWADVVALAPEAKSFPSGFLQTWPDESPLTLHTLASLMISISDNTAADQLLRALGREKVEQMLQQTGNATPKRNIPFLSTSEMFKLKARGGKLAAEYITKDTEAARRAMLASEVAETQFSLADFSNRPLYVDTVQWFASAADLCRLMNWLRQQTENKPASRARQILSINPGLNLASRAKWKYIGYKGGSEPGVLNLTYLLQSQSGEWYAVSASWNNPNAPIELEKLTGLISRAIQLIL